MAFFNILITIVIMSLVIIFTKFTKWMEKRVDREITELKYDYFDDKDYYKLKKRKIFYQSIRYIFLFVFYFSLIFLFSYLIQKYIG